MSAATNDSDGCLSREEQRFRQAWLRALVCVATLLPVGLFAWGIVQQVALGRPWGNRPTSDAALIGAAALAVTIAVAIAVLFLRACLETEVRRDGLFVRFRPFHRRWQRIDLARATSVEARTYRPLREYGGWGIRYGFAGKAYNVSGTRGVQLKFVDSEPLLIGSQRADELAAAITALRRG